MKLDEFIEELQRNREILFEKGKDTEIVFAGFNPNMEEDIEIKLTGFDTGHYSDKNILFVDLHVNKSENEELIDTIMYLDSTIKETVNAIKVTTEALYKYLKKQTEGEIDE